MMRNRIADVLARLPVRDGSDPLSELDTLRRLEAADAVMDVIGGATAPVHADRIANATMFETGLSFLDKLAADYPYRVEGPDSVEGEEGERFGSCISRPFPEGRRTWAFEHLGARDQMWSYLASLLTPRGSSVPRPIPPKMPNSLRVNEFEDIDHALDTYEQYFWTIVDGNGLTGLPSDMWEALSILVERAASAEVAK